MGLQQKRNRKQAAELAIALIEATQTKGCFGRACNQELKDRKPDGSCGIVDPTDAMCDVCICWSDPIHEMLSEAPEETYFNGIYDYVDEDLFK